MVLALLCISCGSTNNKKDRNKTVKTEVRKPLLVNDLDVSTSSTRSLVKDCNTTQKIEFLGNIPKKSTVYIIGTAHTYEDTANLQGYIYDNGGLILKAFQKIHELEGTTKPLPLYTEGIDVGFSSSLSALPKVIPQCVIDMGYSVAFGIDVREEAHQAGLFTKNFSQVFTEYCDVKPKEDGGFTGSLKKDMPSSVFLWLRDVWYPNEVYPGLLLEKSIISKMNENNAGIIICGTLHVIKIGLSGKLDWAIIAVNNGKAFLETEEEGRMSNRIIAERYVCEAVLKMPYLP